MKKLRDIIEPFVRDILGCGCPEEVFSDIRVVKNMDAFAGLPVDYLLEIGGRLLIAVCAADPGHDIPAHLSRLAWTGRQVRDRRGFNRFRLVIPRTDPMACQELQQSFEDLIQGDERMHLHIVDPMILPRFPS